MKYTISRRNGVLLLLVVLGAGLAMSILTALFAHQSNGYFGFPLDDAWIHLQFAKNLHDYGTFSYYKNEMVTSGSTSPLYTLILALGFFCTHDEMILSYFLGVAFLLAGAFFLFRIIVEDVNDVFMAAAAALLFLLEPRLQWIALSGMETTLFVALTLATLYYYKRKKPVMIGIGCGLLVWTRPEGLVLACALAIDLLYHTYAPSTGKERKKGREVKLSLRWIRSAVVIFAAT